MRRGSTESREAGMAIEARVARRVAVRRHRRAALMLRMGNSIRRRCVLDHWVERVAGVDYLEAPCSYADGGGLGSTDHGKPDVFDRRISSGVFEFRAFAYRALAYGAHSCAGGFIPGLRRHARRPQEERALGHGGATAGKVRIAGCGQSWNGRTGRERASENLVAE